MPDYTPEQKQVVEEILSITHTDYYRVLKVDKSASDVEIKKSYRKLAIKLHPDKNKHPKASEAFKVIAKAFEVLGDESKRKMYDMTGSDPDSRGGGGGGGASPGFQNFRGFPQGFQGFQGFPQGAGMGGGLNDDILNMLFGGLGGGNNGFSFQFGNGMQDNGFFYSNPAMNARRRAGQQHRSNRRNANGQANQPESPKWLPTLIQFIPLLIILFSMLMNSFSGGSESSSSRTNVKQFYGRPPAYQYLESEDFKIERATPKYNVHYFIREDTLRDFSGRKNSDAELLGLDKYVEYKYVEQLEFGCKREQAYKRDMIEGAKGILFNDWETIDRANAMELPHCQKLEELNLL